MITNNRYTIPSVRLLSDLHMEGFRFDYEFQGEDILILAGDIHTLNRHEVLLQKVPENVQILMVSGNHSYYRSDFDQVNNELSELENKFANFKFLNNSTFVYNDIYFYGGTMFSDFLLYGVTNQFAVEISADNGISDFNIIKFGNDRWTTKNHIDQHNIFVEGLKNFIETAGEKRVVISHFCPSEKSVHFRYGKNLLNGYFASNMEKYMDTIGYWFHGHTHDSFDYKLGNTRIVCNPKGYGSENKDFNPNLILPLEFSNV